MFCTTRGASTLWIGNRPREPPGKSRMLRLVILGNLAGEPYPGIAWQVAHFVIGLSRLGHDVYYFETSSAWPYDPIREARVNDSEYAVSYLARMADHFGFGE